jgi:hypothetical protein
MFKKKPLYYIKYITMTTPIVIFKTPTHTDSLKKNMVLIDIMENSLIVLNLPMDVKLREVYNLFRAFDG